MPHKLCRSDCRYRYKAYRLHIPAPGDATNQGLYVRMFDGSMSAFLNGNKVGQTGSMREPIADMTYQPAYFDLPKSLWSDGVNEIDIVVASLVEAGGRLTPPFVGDAVPLQRAFGVAHGLTVDSLAIINGILLVFVFAAALFYFSTDRDPLFIWFALLIVFCIARNLNILLPEWPADAVMRNTIYLSATLGVLLSAGGFISRLSATNSTRLDVLLIAAWLPATIAIAIGLRIDMWGTWGVAIVGIRLLTLTLGSWLIIRFLLYSRTLPPIVQASTFGLLGAALSLMLHDSIGSASGRLLIFQTSNLAALPIVLTFCIVLAHRYRQHLVRINSQNKMLASAVARKEAELESSYAQLGKVRDAEVLADERQRIMQDMHDGVGGRLATLLQRLHRGTTDNANFASELQTSLNDLRLIIDSLDDTTNSNLAFALGTFKQRIQPWLAENEINLVWQVSLDDEHHLGPVRTLQLYRILQEALNNVVRHAHATEVAIRVDDVNQMLNVSVADNGKGLPESLLRGKGLDIMARRAKAMQGQLSLDSSSAGLNVALCVSLTPP